MHGKRLYCLRKVLCYKATRHKTIHGGPNTSTCKRELYKYSWRTQRNVFKNWHTHVWFSQVWCDKSILLCWTFNIYLTSDKRSKRYPYIWKPWYHYRKTPFSKYIPNRTIRRHSAPYRWHQPMILYKPMLFLERVPLQGYLNGIGSLPGCAGACNMGFILALSAFREFAIMSEHTRAFTIRQ